MLYDIIIKLVESRSKDLTHIYEKLHLHFSGPYSLAYNSAYPGLNFTMF